MVGLVVFDCDGVLVDSEALVLDVEAATLSAAGFPITADEIAERFTGISYASMLRALSRDFGRAIPNDLSEEVQRNALERMAEALEPVAGIDRVLGSSTLPRCVASSSDVARIEMSLRVTGLASYFAPDHVFSAEMVRNGKPAPDLFLLAAERMGISPSECLVVEDSPPGVEAACAAGMAVVGFVAGGHVRPSLRPRLVAAGATEICSNAEELENYLRRHEPSF